MKTYFAWSNHQPFDPTDHARMDLDILTLSLTHKEGEVAQVILTALNAPDVGGRFGQTAYMSYGSPENPQLFFKGRLAGLPECLTPHKTRLIFCAIPDDLEAQLSTLESSLKHAPFWDPLFVPPTDEQHTGEWLEGRSELFDINRTTHQVRLCSIFQGHETVTVAPEHLFTNHLKVTVDDLPFAYADVTVQSEWVQHAQGEFNAFPQIARHFSGQMVNTLTPRALINAWPESGVRLQRSGYTILSSRLREITPPHTGALHLYPTLSASFTHKERPNQRLKRKWFKGRLDIGWSFRQKRQETVTYRLHHAHKLTPAHPQHGKKLFFKLQALDVDRTGQGPALESSEKGVFFETARGQEAIRHSIHRAAAYLAARGRCVRLTCRVPFDIALHWGPATSLIFEEIGTLLPQFFSQVHTLTGKIKNIILNQSATHAYADVTVLLSPGMSDAPAGTLTDTPLTIEGLTPPEGIQDPSALTFIQNIQIANDGAAQSEWLQAEGTPDLAQLPPTQILLDLHSLKTKGVMQRFYRIKERLTFASPRQLSL